MQSTPDTDVIDVPPTGDVDDRGETPAEPLSVPFDLEDRAFEYVVRLGLPGYRREEVTVAVEDALVRVTTHAGAATRSPRRSLAANVPAERSGRPSGSPRPSLRTGPGSRSRTAS